jgi:4-amino-4-deoxy-L-arabinose transferase-like glycosyltransferase
MTVALLALIGVGLGIRMLDLTDPPLDFHAWRQLRSAIIARGKYYSLDTNADPYLREKAIQLGESEGKLEPIILETISAITYWIVGREELWIARVYSIFFWMIGGIFLYLLARKCTSTLGASLSLAYYLLVPFGVIGSRAFLPEPLMAMWIMISSWCLYQWSEKKTWTWALLFGITAGLAILTKVFAVFPVGCAAIAVVLHTWGLRRTIRNPQVWTTAAIMTLIPALYYILPSASSGTSYLKEWVFPYSYLLLQPGFYVRWLTVLHDLVNLFPLFTSLIGVTLLKGQGRALAFGLWLGYWLTGMTVPSLIRSHTYYNLPLIPILALPLAPIGEFLLSKIAQQPLRWRLLFTFTVLASLAYPMILSRNELVARNYREEAKGWVKIADILPEGSLIGMTHDYGKRIAYYAWRGVATWPSVYDFRMQELARGSADPNDPDWASILVRRMEPYDYFVITVMNELEAQPIVKSTLFSTYEVYLQENGILIFDLKNKSSP